MFFYFEKNFMNLRLNLLRHFVLSRPIFSGSQTKVFAIDIKLNIKYETYKNALYYLNYLKHTQ